MKSICTLLFAIGLMLQLSAQDYHELISEDHRWHSQQGGFFIFNADQYFSGDTLIGEYTYHRFYSILDLAPDQPALDGLLREDVDEQRVYLWDGEQDQLLYDFDVEVGDTLSVSGLLCETEVVVIGIETEMVYGQEREKILLDGGDAEYWIEGIGSVYSVMHPGLWHCQISDVEAVLRCFYDTGELFWSNPLITEECAEIITSVESTQEHVAVVYPNPVTDALNLIATNGKLVSCTITDVSGKLFVDTQLDPAIQHQLNVSDLPVGMYFLSMKWEDSSTTRSTFLKY